MKSRLKIKQLNELLNQDFQKFFMINNKKILEKLKLSYDIFEFEEIVYFITNTLETQRKSTNKIMQTLILIDYLLKHGCSAFIDVFTE